MKAQALFLTVLFSLATLSCNSDDDNSNGSEDPLNASWNLTNVYGGLIAVDIDYTSDEVIWTFDTTNEVVTIQNNVITNGPEQIHSGLESGVYSYEIIIETLEEALYIEGERIGIIVVENNSFLIDNGLSSDGFLSTYIKR